MHLRSLENKAFLVLLALVTLAFLWVLGGFLLPVFWATVLAVLFSPLFRRFRTTLGGRGTPAALLTLLAVLLMVVVPVVFIGFAVTNEAVGVYGQVARGEIDVAGAIHAAEGLQPRIQALAERFGYVVDFERVQASASAAALDVSRAVAGQLLTVGQRALHATLLLVVSLYVLFFFLRDGERLIEALVRALPLGDPRERRLFERFTAVTRATVRGTFVVAAVQGSIGGLAFLALGLGSPFLWGVLMGLFSLIPAVGSALVWGPAALYLIATGAWVKGVILIGIGAGVIGVVDNALRPILVGRDAGMPDYLILLSTLGGLGTFGFSGLVIGPVVAGLFLSTWDIFAEEFGPADDQTLAELAPGPEGTPATDAQPVTAVPPLAEVQVQPPVDPPLSAA